MPAERTAGELDRREALFQRLRELRRTIAVQEGVPPYVIFHDSTLQEMADRQPLSVADMLRISGVGERKWERYGMLFLLEIQQFVSGDSAENAGP
jgi:ATP-dependent DNA helicase RecQ